MNETTREAIVPGDASRLAAALEQNEQDAVALLALVDQAAPWLPEHLAEAMRNRLTDVARHAGKALEGDEAHKRDITVRAQREDLMRRALGERIGQLDAARIVAATLAGHELKPVWTDEAAEARALAGAEAFARQMGLSSGEWQTVRKRPAEASRAALLGVSPSGPGIGEPVYDGKPAAGVLSASKLLANGLGALAPVCGATLGPSKPCIKPADHVAHETAKGASWGVAGYPATKYPKAKAKPAKAPKKATKRPAKAKVKVKAKKGGRR